MALIDPGLKTNKFNAGTLTSSERPNGQQPTGIAVHAESAAHVGEEMHSSRGVAFYFALGLIFTRFGLVHEMLTNQLGFNAYLLYVFGIPALVGVVLAGGLRRTLRFRPAIYWVCFAFWLIPTTAFSIWKGGSVEILTTYYRTNLIMLFVLAGLAFSWRECKLMLNTIAAASIATLGFLLLFGQRDENGRTSLRFGAIANSNDYACHLILVLPFLLWIILSSKSQLRRFVALLIFGFGIYQVFASGSRGALLGVAAGLVLYLLSVSGKQRRIALIVAPAVVLVAFSLLPGATVKRIFAFKSEQGISKTEAAESSQIRQRLLVDSLWITLKHPFLGVGPGQFGTIEHTQRVAGLALWFQTHNSYTQASSEMGIPGLVFFLGGVISSLILLHRITLKCRGHEEYTEIAKGVTCVRIALVAFAVTIFFLNFAYTFYLPALAGLIIAMAQAVGLPNGESPEANTNSSAEEPRARVLAG